MSENLEPLKPKDLGNKVAPEIIAERVSELSTLVDELITQRSEMRIGEQIRVLIEDADEQEGRAEHQGPDVDGSTFVQSMNICSDVIIKSVKKFRGSNHDRCHHHEMCL